MGAQRETHVNEHENASANEDGDTGTGADIVNSAQRDTHVNENENTSENGDCDTGTGADIVKCSCDESDSRGNCDSGENNNNDNDSDTGTGAGIAESGCDVHDSHETSDHGTDASSNDNNDSGCSVPGSPRRRSVHVAIKDKTTSRAFVVVNPAGRASVPGGWQEVGESGEETAYRELHEEADIRRDSQHWVMRLRRGSGSGASGAV